MTPGEVVLGPGSIVINAGASTTRLVVRNLADRPVQVGSHFHFAEVNSGLELDRQAAWGLRLDIPAGTGMRFEPGIEREVTLVPIRGRRVVPGLRGLAGGMLDEVTTSVASRDG